MNALLNRSPAVCTFALAVILLQGLLPSSAWAVTPAGTVIGNQATATYVDSSGTSRTSTSNLVQTTVSQVKSFTLTAAGAKTGTPGQTVYYPHTITNTGNGTDTYSLTAAVAGGTVTQTGLTYYVDANGDGVPDNFTPITSSGALAAGGQFNYVVAATIPATATAGTTGTVTVAAADTGGNTASNIDTTTVANSVINVTKALSSSSGAAGVAGITVTLSYSNAGSQAATTVVLTDTLPTGMTYTPGSGRWSTSGSTALTDAAGGDPTGIAYDYNITTAGTVTATIASVAAGTSGTVTFTVGINSGLAPTTPSNQAVTTNTASFKSDQQTTATNTNSVVYRVTQSASVTATGQTIASAAQGATVSFSNIITNTGNGPDSFDITLPAVGTALNTFPTGTTFALFQSDGATSLLDSNGNGTPDTGTLAAGAAFTVVVKATLPTGATGGPFAVTKTATSKFDPTKSATATDTLTAITNSTVDVTQNTARADSTPAGTAVTGNSATTGWGATSTVIATNTVTPSTTAVTTTAFKLYVNNTGAGADTFDLATTSTIPTGYSVAFYNDGGGATCTTLGGALTNTGTIAGGANKLVCAVVSVPSTSSGNATAGTNSFVFRAQSPVNATSTDSITDAVTVSAIHSLTLTPNGTQQTFAGGAVLYTHTLRNTGNSTETVTYATGFLTDSQSAAGWTSLAYLDTNANGVYDAGTDTLITTSSTMTVAPNATATLFVRVLAPGTATASSPADVTTFTVTYNGATATTFATDTTSVSNGLLLSKTQQANTCAASLATGGFSANAIAAGTNTAPGKCVSYQITATNTTAAPITTVVLSDLTPSNTTLEITSCFTPVATGGATVGGTATTEGSTGAVTATLATLAPSAAFNLTFCVKINP